MIQQKLLLKAFSIMIVLFLLISPSKVILSEANAFGNILPLLSVVAKPLCQGFARWGFEKYCKAKFPKNHADIIKILSPLVELFPNLKNAPGTSKAFKEAYYATESIQQNEQLRKDILFQFNKLKERQNEVLLEIQSMYLVVVDTNERVKRLESKLDKVISITNSNKNTYIPETYDFKTRLKELISESDNNFINIIGKDETEVGSFYTTKKLPGSIFGHVYSNNFHCIFLNDFHQAADEKTEAKKKAIAKNIYNELVWKIRNSVSTSWDFTESIESYQLNKSEWLWQTLEKTEKNNIGFPRPGKVHIFTAIEKNPGRKLQLTFSHSFTTYSLLPENYFKIYSTWPMEFSIVLSIYSKHNLAKK